MALTEDIEVTLGRPSCCEYAAGRVFYGFRNTIYFSQVLVGNSMSGIDKCYQVNDPTSEQISDLLATDGGTVQVDDAVNIVQIKKFRGGVMVYATNGVWLLADGAGGFSATDYALTQVTSAGCISPQSVVVVDDMHMFWSDEGIFSIAIDEFGNPRANSLVEGAYQTAYNELSLITKQKSTGSYNRIKKQVEWMYNEASQEGSGEFKYAYNKSLIYDLRSGGWWPQAYNGLLESQQGGKLTADYFIGSIVDTTLGTEDEDTLMVVIESAPSSLSVDNFGLFLGKKTNTSFQDFNGISYETAYIETGYETLGKPSNKKIAPYTTLHFLQTEQNWIDDGSGGLTLDNQSSCQFRVKWDWNNSATNGRWSPVQQGYRFRRINIPASAGAFDSGEQVITTRNKILGRGNALSMRFEQEAGKDMKLLGYTTTYTVKGRM